MTAFEETVSAGGHKDATMHVGGHGEPWPEIKVIMVTRDGRTCVCIRNDKDETVIPVSSVREGLEIFAGDSRRRSRNCRTALPGHAGSTARRRNRPNRRRLRRSGLYQLTGPAPLLTPGPPALMCSRAARGPIAVRTRPPLPMRILSPGASRR